ncbi:MAG TPA: TadE/TadG family type IV pilus assembly protein [Gemmatimonadaceae bacterium]
MRRMRFAHSERGAAMVEFAIVLPLLLLLVFGIIDFGRALYTLNNLTSAVREGGRYAAANVDDPTTTAAIDAVKAKVTADVIAFGGNPQDPTVTVVPDAPYPATQSITVSIVDYPFTPLTPLASMIGLGSITMSPSAVFRWEGAQ